MEIWHAIVLGIVEGITEFLPISSTGHLVLVEKLLDLSIDDPAVIAYTAVIQVGAIGAVVVYFARDIGRLAAAWFTGLVSRPARGSYDYRLAWYVIAGSLPIVVVGLLAQDVVTGPVWNLWTVAGGMIVFSGVMVYAERVSTRVRDEQQLRLTDALIIGVAQCLALVPGVSRAAATISVGLLRNLDRVTATRFSFLLAIPALVGAGVLELGEVRAGDTVSTAALVTGTVISFVVAYAAIVWLLRFVAHHSLLTFVWYRVGFGALIIVLLTSGTITAT